MSKARLVLTALFLDHQSPAEVAARYGVNRSWVYKLKTRYEADGEAAFEPRSRRPHTSPGALEADTVALITELRARLDAGRWRSSAVWPTVSSSESTPVETGRRPMRLS